MGGTHVFPSDLGWFAVVWSGDQLMQLTFGHPSAAAAIACMDVEGFGATDSKSVPKWISQLTERLQSYAAGNDEQFDDVPLSLSHLSTFQSSVVRACRNIARGRVRTYGELAAVAGADGAARA